MGTMHVTFTMYVIAANGTHIIESSWCIVIESLTWVLYPMAPLPQVAILCNHQRSVPKSFEGSMARLDEKITAA